MELPTLQCGGGEEGSSESEGQQTGQTNEKESQGSSGFTCFACRVSKVRCDKRTPCARCTRLGLECVSQGRGPGRPPKNGECPIRIRKPKPRGAAKSDGNKQDSKRSQGSSQGNGSAPHDPHTTPFEAGDHGLDFSAVMPMACARDHSAAVGTVSLPSSSGAGASGAMLPPSISPLRGSTSVEQRLGLKRRPTQTTAASSALAYRVESRLGPTVAMESGQMMQVNPPLTLASENRLQHQEQEDDMNNKRRKDDLGRVLRMGRVTFAVPTRFAELMTSYLSQALDSRRVDHGKALACLRIWSLCAYRSGADFTWGLLGNASNLLQRAGHELRTTTELVFVGPSQSEVPHDFGTDIDNPTFEWDKVPEPLKRLNEGRRSALSAYIYINGVFRIFANDRFAELYMTAQECNQRMVEEGMMPVFVWARCFNEEGMGTFLQNMIHVAYTSHSNGGEASQLITTIDRSGQELPCLMRIRYVFLNGGNYAAVVLSLLPLPNMAIDDGQDMSIPDPTREGPPPIPLIGSQPAVQPNPPSPLLLPHVHPVGAEPGMQSYQMAPHTEVTIVQEDQQQQQQQQQQLHLQQQQPPPPLPSLFATHPTLPVHLQHVYRRTLQSTAPQVSSGADSLHGYSGAAHEGVRSYDGYSTQHSTVPLSSSRARVDKAFTHATGLTNNPFGPSPQVVQASLTQPTVDVASSSSSPPYQYANQHIGMAELRQPPDPPPVAPNLEPRSPSQQGEWSGSAVTWSATPPPVPPEMLARFTQAMAARGGTFSRSSSCSSTSSSIASQPTQCWGPDEQRHLAFPPQQLERQIGQDPVSYKPNAGFAPRSQPSIFGSTFLSMPSAFPQPFRPLSGDKIQHHADNMSSEMGSDASPPEVLALSRLLVDRGCRVQVEVPYPTVSASNPSMSTPVTPEVSASTDVSSPPAPLSTQISGNYHMAVASSASMLGHSASTLDFLTVCPPQAANEQDTEIRRPEAVAWGDEEEEERAAVAFAVAEGQAEQVMVRPPTRSGSSLLVPLADYLFGEDMEGDFLETLESAAILEGNFTLEELAALEEMEQPPGRRL